MGSWDTGFWGHGARLSAPAPLFRVWVFCSRGSLTPVAAPNVFLAVGRLRRSGFGAIVLRDVPEGQMWKPGLTYPATVAALPPAPLFRFWIFCSRGSLTPVAALNVFLAVDRLRRSGFGAVS